MKYSLMDKKSADENSADFFLSIAVGLGVRGKGILFIRSLGPDREVIFLFSAKRPLRKVELSSYSRRAGQRRCFQRICLAGDYMGRPSLRSGSRSLQKNHFPVRPKLRPILLPRTCCSRSKNIDVLVAYPRGKIHFIRTSLRAEVVMLFAVERLSERSEDWPTNGID